MLRSGQKAFFVFYGVVLLCLISEGCRMLGFLN
jgi:hypothetical protein